MCTSYVFASITALAGFEPANAGVKVLCLTAWLKGFTNIPINDIILKHQINMLGIEAIEFLLCLFPLFIN